MAQRTKSSLDRISELDLESKPTNLKISSNIVEYEYFGAQIPREVVLRLKHVALNRKAKRVEPWKMKELVEAALIEWLERNEK